MFVTRSISLTAGMVLALSVAASAQPDPDYQLNAGMASGMNGTMVTVSVRLTNAEAVGAFQFGLAHDAAVAQLMTVSAGSDITPDMFQGDPNPGGGSGGTVVGTVFSGIPIGTDQEIATFEYLIVGPPGSRTDLTFTDTLGDPDPVVINLSDTGGLMDILPITKTGEISVEGVPTEFIRGDTNGDGSVDISDALRLADALFVLGADPLTCDDAGDTNDDGGLDGLMDTIFLLNDLFLEGPDVPSPNLFAGGCGVDPTADALECDASGCP